MSKRRDLESFLKQKVAEGTVLPESYDLWPHNYDGSFADVEYNGETRTWDFTISVNSEKAFKVLEFLKTLAWDPEESVDDDDD